MSKNNKTKINVIKVNEDIIVFTVSGVSVGQANRVRQMIIEDIPTMCIEFVKIRKNNAGALIDEFLVHRLGMIPMISNDIDKFYRSKVCPCTDYCDQCYVRLTLDVETTDKQKNVYSKDLVSNSKNVIPVSKHIYITKLDTDEHIDLTCYVAKGTGKEHTAHSAVSTVGFDYQTENKTMKGLLWNNTDGETTYVPKKIPPKEIKFTLNLIGNVNPDMMIRYVTGFFKEVISEE
jgi:DNA-directed RNA polymerase II subunit RPB3